MSRREGIWGDLREQQCEGAASPAPLRSVSPVSSIAASRRRRGETSLSERGACNPAPVAEGGTAASGPPILGAHTGHGHPQSSCSPFWTPKLPQNLELLLPSDGVQQDKPQPPPRRLQDPQIPRPGGCGRKAALPAPSTQLQGCLWAPGLREEGGCGVLGPGRRSSLMGVTFSQVALGLCSLAELQPAPNKSQHPGSSRRGAAPSVRAVTANLELSGRSPAFLLSRPPCRGWCWVT